MKPTMLSTCLVLLVIAPAHAIAQATSRPGYSPERFPRETITKPATDNEQAAQKLISWTASPASAPRPALRYRLLPALTEQTSGNAASTYYIAAMLLREHSDAEAIDPDDWVNLPPDQFPLSEVKRFLEGDLREPLEHLDVAARRDNCDWGHPARERGYNTLLPELNSLHMLSYWLRLRTRVALIEGRYDDALRSVQTNMAMAQHVARGRTMVNVLTAAGIARQALDSARELAAAPDGPNLYWSLSDLPQPAFSIRECFEFESAALATALQAGRLRVDLPLSGQQLSEIVDNLSRTAMSGMYVESRAALAIRAAGDLPKARAFLLADGATAQQLDGLPPLQVALLYYGRTLEYAIEETAKYTGLPFHIGYPRAAADTAFSDLIEANPLSMLIPPQSNWPWRALSAIDRQVAAMQVVESARAYAAAHDGKLPASLDDLTDMPAPADPFTGKPFAYKADGNTVNLSGPALSERDSPLSYRVKISR